MKHHVLPVVLLALLASPATFPVGQSVGASAENKQPYIGTGTLLTLSDSQAEIQIVDAPGKAPRTMRFVINENTKRGQFTIGRIVMVTYIKEGGRLVAIALTGTGVTAPAGAATPYGVKGPPIESGDSRRLALVIGNSSYPWTPLKNPENDATDVAAALERDGFVHSDVHLVTNLKGLDMRVAVREFVESVKPGDFAFIYYSGHGVEVKGTNYLLPIDIPGDASELEVEDEAVSAQRIVGDLESQGAAVTILVLDACRDNPLRAARSAGGGGLAPMEGLGSLVVFATEAGHTASDNTAGRNGLFTQYLLKALAMKGVSLDDAIRDIARQMAADTNRKQIPAIYGLLERPVYLAAPPAASGLAPVSPAPDPDVAAWNAIQDSRNQQDYEDFAAAYPQSQYAAAAKLRANQLKREATLTPPAPNGNNAALHPMDDSAAVTLVIQRYADGVNSGDLEKIKAVRQFHGNEEKRMVANLDAVRGKGYALRNCAAPQVTGDNAQVSCDVVLTNSKEPAPPGRVTFLLKRIYGQWFILTSN